MSSGTDSGVPRVHVLMQGVCCLPPRYPHVILNSLCYPKPPGLFLLVPPETTQILYCSKHTSVGKYSATQCTSSAAANGLKFGSERYQDLCVSSLKNPHKDLVSSLTSSNVPLSLAGWCTPSNLSWSLWTCSTHSSLQFSVHSIHKQNALLSMSVAPAPPLATAFHTLRRTTPAGWWAITARSPAVRKWWKRSTKTDQSGKHCNNATTIVQVDNVQVESTKQCWGN